MANVTSRRERGNGASIPRQPIRIEENLGLGWRRGRPRVAMISVHTCPLAAPGARETGGMNVYVRELSRHLGTIGVSVDVFTRRQGAEVPEVVPFSENARVIHLSAGADRPMDKYRVLEHLPDFVDGLERFRRRLGIEYDVVHSHYWLSSPVSTVLAKRWGAPLVTMFHTLGRIKNEVSSGVSEQEHAPRFAIEREALRASRFVVAASPTDREQMVRYYGAGGANVRVIPAGVDTAVFRPQPRGMSRELVGMGSGPQILFVGRIQQLKGIDLLVRAYSVLMSRWTSGRRPSLTIVGGVNGADASDPETEERRRLSELARGLEVENSVRFLDAVPHRSLPNYYSAADLVVTPSLYESFGLVALEAMACGTPVVASRVGGLQWTVRDGETGFLVERRQPELYAAAMELLLSDEPLRRRMSEASVRTATRYSWHSVAEQILHLYGEAAATEVVRRACCAR